MSWMQRLKRLTQGVTHTQPPITEASAPILTPQDLLNLTEEYAQLPAQILSENRANPPLSHAMRQGEQLSPFTGSGFEYQESRPYQVGDEIRRINWPLMAKTGKAYTKYFQEERQANGFILVDHRHSMRFGTRTRLKATQASRIAGYFAWLMQQSATPMIGARLTGRLEQTSVLEGRGSYEKIMQLFSAPCPPYPDSMEPAHQDAQFNDVLLDLLPQIQMGTRLILISDFQDITPQTTQRLIALQQRAILTVICIQDPVELMLPAIQGLQLHSLKGSSTLTIDTESQRQAYQTWATQHQRTLQSHLQQAGITPWRLQTDHPLSALTQVNHIEATHDRTTELAHAQ